MKEQDVTMSLTPTVITASDKCHTVEILLTAATMLVTFVVVYLTMFEGRTGF